jgi:hypothetical protein
MKREKEKEGGKRNGVVQEIRPTSNKTIERKTTLVTHTDTSTAQQEAS